MNFVLVPIVVIVLIISPISAKNKCNDDCLTKTYCLSTSGTPSCNTENLFKAKWSASQISYADFVTLTLTAANVKSSEMRTMSLVVKNPKNPKSFTNYTCFKSAISVTPTVLQQAPTSSLTIPNGESSFLNGILSCSWSFTMYDNTWPLYYDKVARLVSDKSGIIELGSVDKSTVVAQDVSALPIYQLQYLNCCNKVHGNSGYKMIFNQTKGTNYLIRPIGNTIAQLTLTLTNTNGQLTFLCDFKNLKIDSLVFNKTKSTSINNLLYNPNVYTNYDPKCYWSHPLLLTGTFGKFDTTNGVFDMTLVADGQVVYTEKGVKLNNSASMLISLTSFIITFISVLVSLTYH